MNASEIRVIGSRRELLLDTWLIETLSGGAALHLHRPTRREAALITDQPWEGNMCGYVTVFQDGERCRMYYHTGNFDPQGRFQPSGIAVALAESRDAIHWDRVMLELHEWAGTCRNNVVWVGEGEDFKGVHGFAPFKDPRPDVPEGWRYKALGAGLTRTEDGLFALRSSDGVHWALVQEEPVIREGAFDSQNLAFWDGERGEYRAYVRDFCAGQRGIRTCTSPDFVHWGTPEWLEYPGAPPEQLYTNQIMPYPRAPHLFVGFPTRYVERPWSPAVEALPELAHRRLRASLHPRYGAALTDGLFMSSRDGRTFTRWGEAFIRPGPQLEGNWTYGDNYQCWGLLETSSDLEGAPPELSFYATEHYWRGSYTIFRRYTLRMDGFVSVQAPLRGGELLTKPVRFTGQRLHLNVATSAAGSVRVELQDTEGHPLEGYTLDDCVPVIGDELERVVTWKGGDAVGALAETPVRLRFVLQDADLYALQFA